MTSQEYYQRNKARLKAQHAARLAAMSPGELAAHKARQKATRQEWLARNPGYHRSNYMQKREQWLAKTKEDRAGRTPEQRAAEREKQREYRRLNPRRRPVTFDEWLRRRVAGIRTHAQRNGIPFDMSAADLSVPERCPILGIPLRLRPPGIGGRRDSPSIDRVFPEKGYVHGNVFVISRKANTMKSDMTPDQIRALLAYVECAELAS
jgi:hypothetical protein